MIYGVFQVRDSKAEAHHIPFYAPTIAVAIRMIENTQRDETNNYTVNATDFALFHGGEWDESTGITTGFEQPVHIANLIDLVTSRPLEAVS